MDGRFNPPTGNTLFENLYLNTDSTFSSIFLNPNPNVSASGKTVISNSLPIVEVSEYAFQAPPDWGRRSSPGEVQAALNEMLAAQIDVDLALKTYNSWTETVSLMTYDTQQKLVSIKGQMEFKAYYQDLKIGIAVLISDIKTILESIETTAKESKNLGEAARESIPDNLVAVGGDVLAPVEGGLEMMEAVTETAFNGEKLAKSFFGNTLELSFKITEIIESSSKETFSLYNEFLASLFELSKELNNSEVQIGALTAPLQRLHMASDKVRKVIAEADRLQAERTALNLQIAAKAQRNRYADLVTRINHNEALRKYDRLLDNAARHVWLAIKTYDYETSLSENHPASATGLLNSLVKTRDFGSLSDILDRVERDYDVLQGQLGLNNSLGEANIVSLRSEMMRISPSATSDARWREALSATRVADLWQVPEFRNLCRPFAPRAMGPQPGLVIRFSTEITPGKNLFGQPLSGLDHAFSAANFGTKIRSFTAAFPGYDKDAWLTAPQLSVSPRFYLVPAGLDRQYCSDTAEPTVRTWNVLSQRIPVPENLNAASLADPFYQPSMNGLDGHYAERIRFGDARAFITDDGLTGVDDMTLSPLTPDWNSSSRLYGRSVWNTQWVLILPGATLNADPDAGLTRFIDTVTDIKLYLETYSNQGM